MLMLETTLIARLRSAVDPTHRKTRLTTTHPHHQGAGMARPCRPGALRTLPLAAVLCLALAAGARAFCVPLSTSKVYQAAVADQLTTVDL